jgi:curved DNA-binding protein CbpA
MPSYPISEEDAYRTLEIKVGATEVEIKSAYKKLALRTHPDKNPNDASANKRFLAVSEAYKRLTEEEFSDDEDYDDYDDEDEDFDISEIFAFRMFERMFFDAASGSQRKGGGSSGGKNRSNSNAQGSNGAGSAANGAGSAAGSAASGGVQFSFPGMVSGGGCNCPDCRRRFGYEKTKPWREYVPKSQRTDIPKETVKEVDPSIHDNWLSDEELDGPKVKGTTSKTKSKKAQKRENAAKEQKAQIERLGTFFCILMSPFAQFSVQRMSCLSNNNHIYIP